MGTSGGGNSLLATSKAIIACVLIFLALVFLEERSALFSRRSFSSAAASSKKQKTRGSMQNRTWKTNESSVNPLLKSTIVHTAEKQHTCSISVINECLQVLGNNGAWIQDWEFAEAYGREVQPRNIDLGGVLKHWLAHFKPKEGAPFPWEISWRWVDYNNVALPDNDAMLRSVLMTTAPNITGNATAQMNGAIPIPVSGNETSSDLSWCQIDYTINSSAEKVCNILQALNIKHLLFMGDSLQRYAHESFINRMGQTPILQFYRRNIFKHTLNCPVINQRTNETTVHAVDVQYIGFEGGQAFSYTAHVPLFFKNETLDLLRHTSGEEEPILVLFNIGPHYHNISQFTTDAQTVVQIFQSLNRSKSYYFFRTTPPGHNRCNPTFPSHPWVLENSMRETPYPDYDAYLAYQSRFSSDKYGWNLFDQYNVIFRNMAGPLFHIMNVYNMTALRRDGHFGGDDCLHYRPGPGDWWNHLFFTKLKLLGQCITHS